MCARTPSFSVQGVQTAPQRLRSQIELERANLELARREKSHALSVARALELLARMAADGGGGHERHAILPLLVRSNFACFCLHDVRTTQVVVRRPAPAKVSRSLSWDNLPSEQSLSVRLHASCFFRSIIQVRPQRPACSSGKAGWHWSTCFISTAMRVVNGRPTWAKAESRSCVANLS